MHAVTFLTLALVCTLEDPATDEFEAAAGDFGLELHPLTTTSAAIKTAVSSRIFFVLNIIKPSCRPEARRQDRGSGNGLLSSLYFDQATMRWSPFI
jgi:hypothetical protein